MTRTILQSDFFNALYENGRLTTSGKPYLVDAETLAQVFPESAFFVVPQNVYDEVLDGADYPQELAVFPLERCIRVR